MGCCSSNDKKSKPPPPPPPAPEPTVQQQQQPTVEKKKKEKQPKNEKGPTQEELLYEKVLESASSFTLTDLELLMKLLTESVTKMDLERILKISQIVKNILNSNVEELKKLFFAKYDVGKM